jgi:hypothetical protein
MAFQRRSGRVSAMDLVKYYVERKPAGNTRGAGQARAEVHDAPVDSDVQPARTNTQPGAVQPEIEADAWNDRDGAAKTQAHECSFSGS